MSIDISPVLPKGVNLIQAYSNNSFRVNEDKYEDKILLLLPRKLFTFKDKEELLGSFYEYKAELETIEILLIGSGKNRDIKIFVDHELSKIKADYMNTASAISTYNILVSEGRAVASILFPVYTN